MQQICSHIDDKQQQQWQSPGNGNWAINANSSINNFFGILLLITNYLCFVVCVTKYLKIEGKKLFFV